MLTHNFTPAILCLAHLAWDYVWQRPQHILSRLACHYPVIYMNEPQIDPLAVGEPSLKLIASEKNLTAWQPIFPDRQEVLNYWREVYSGLVQALLLRQGWVQRHDSRLVARRPLMLWFYTPTPFYFVNHIPADLIIYDVMDELANFKHAATDLSRREAQLLARADIVFAGGRSLYQTRWGRHPHLYLFPSGVEPEHFAQALDPATEIADQIAHLPRPILGYYGVIDERIDLALLHDLAIARPNWSIVMVGPVTKIELSELPRLANIHYVGQQPYECLPNFLKGFDVCLMPFSINAATRYISPTKALEYMAAHKPIVSTSVPDVVTNWSEVIYIAAGSTQFTAAVEQALAETERQRTERVNCEEKLLALNTWDHITNQMRQRIDAVLFRRIEVM